MALSSIGLLILRLVLGLVLAAHGSQKLFGMFGGFGIKGTGGWMESIGIKPGALFATFAGLGEFLGGLGVAVGLLTPIAAAGVIIVMLVAIASVHIKKGLWNTNGGYEYPLLVIAGALALALTGPGAISLDAVLFK
ncbi:MAG TPA: DoxX family protein [Rectinemataceae bacterium]|nr:DoxX family protein [Rectinemataceae bacterium]